MSNISKLVTAPLSQNGYQHITQNYFRDGKNSDLYVLERRLGDEGETVALNSNTMATLQAASKNGRDVKVIFICQNGSNKVHGAFDLKNNIPRCLGLQTDDSYFQSTITDDVIIRVSKPHQEYWKNSLNLVFRQDKSLRNIFTQAFSQWT